MRTHKRIPPVLLGLLFSAVGVSAQEVLPRVSPMVAGLASEPLQEISAVLQETVADRGIAGGVVGVARGGQVAYLESVGLQDVATGTPMTDRSLFRIYSMTKAVTAVAAMILHEEGRFELSDPVSMYLPAFERVVVLNADGSTRPPSRPPTVEDLFLHTAGLSHRSSSEYRAASVRARDITLEQFVENIVSVPLRADPGQAYRYSAGPTVLGRLVEVWSGQSFDRFVEDRVLEPLGMSDTGFMVQPEDRARFATMYRSAESGLQAYEIEEVPFTERPALIEGAVGLVSTVPDFLRFAQMLVNGGELGGTRILPEATVEQMTQNGLSPAILANRRGGTGWALANVSVVVNADASAGGARAGEYRWDGSAGTEFWVDPSTETILVTMWQSSPANPGRLRQRITALVRQAIGDAR
jgi:CubicO group peptidase (beta-lactamase class C family)